MTEGSGLCHCPPSHQAPRGMHRRKDVRRGVERWEVADGGESMPAVAGENHGQRETTPLLIHWRKEAFLFFSLY